jgi:hypothetical protein
LLEPETHIFSYYMIYQVHWFIYMCTNMFLALNTISQLSSFQKVAQDKTAADY